MRFAFVDALLDSASFLLLVPAHILCIFSSSLDESAPAGRRNESIETKKKKKKLKTRAHFNVAEFGGEGGKHTHAHTHI